MDEQLEKALNDIGLMKVFDHLLAYTRQKMKGLFWQHKKQNGVATKGQEAHDFVNEAVRLALDLREKRKWKPDKEPDPLNHLASVIDSLMSNSYESCENKQASSKDVSELHHLDIDTVHPELLLIAKESEERIRNMVREVAKDDNDPIILVFEALAIDRIESNKMIAELLEITPRQVKYHKSRIRKLKYHH